MVRLLLVIRHAWTMWRVLSLPKNRCKGHWRHHENIELLGLLRKEVDELWAAVWDYECGTGSAENVIAEAADVSNFAAMLADKMRK